MFGITSISTRTKPKATKRSSFLSRLADRSRKSTNMNAVSFVATAMVHEVSNTDSVDRTIIWYTADSLPTSSLVATGKFIDIRGLESVQRFVQRRQEIAATMDAVLDAQIDQWAAGVYDPEELARLSRKITAASQVRAQKTGLKSAFGIK